MQNVISHKKQDNRFVLKFAKIEKAKLIEMSIIIKFKHADDSQ